MSANCPNGILLVDKPAGWTSFDVLAKLRGALHTRKLGHAGTLDPPATGLLVVFIGPATAAAFRMPDNRKTYEARIRFGIRTDTGDSTGTVLEKSEKRVTAQDVCAVLPSFLGERLQKPPMYSAVKMEGRPLYKAARAGQVVDRPARPVTFYELVYLGGDENTCAVRVCCSQGAYIRVLAEEIGQALGVPATLEALRRTRCGAFRLQDAHTLPQILASAQSGELFSSGWVLCTDRAFLTLPPLAVDETVCKHLLNGCPTYRFPAGDGRYRVYDDGGCFLGLASVQSGCLQVEKIFCERGLNPECP